MKFNKQKQQQFQNEPESHDGKTLLELDCSDIEKKKVAALTELKPFKLITNYFQSRCDYEVIDLNKIQKKDHDDIEFDYKWTRNQKELNFDKFKQGKQIINHIKNLKKSLSDKNNLVSNLKEMDKKKMYNFDSNDFHFKTYIFNLKNEKYNKQETKFFQQEKDGIWITKNPYSSLGLGIQLFKNIDQLKQDIMDIKSTELDQDDEEQINKVKSYSLVQKYLDNPLLINNKKVDFRVYVLIVSLDPLIVLYQDGIIKSCIKEYDNDFEEFDQNEAYKHLTNFSFSKTHPQFQELKEQLVMTKEDFENKLRQEYNLTEEKLASMFEDRKKIAAYTTLAGKDKLVVQKGAYQLMGLDMMWDKDFNAKLIEVNTNTSLSNETKVYRQVMPQLVQSTLDLILETYDDFDKVREKWVNPERLELGKWEILINEAQNYNILDKYRQDQQNIDQQEL
ncbi:hypothetical protein PPERSA_10937 [Pseudocohnilembus persalinus]|uniref:Tubulin-tyrosine ligase family protein n=1 Tax=Pseudocohnilembus persalinus TaxID=266149 RepID=A0A0V0QCD7_PSEPJ|nr:hypothetical protein PPERSA_10937 [Pseudocohnilembus persalinus]|eukprot:KRW99818.1 hypothetical protein PPERSA_10937 [Pseudocohnilembus persalinus]